MERTNITQKGYLGGKNGGGLDEFYIHSGSRKNCFSITDPKYKMPSPPPIEQWERVELDDIAYQ